jgi:hypothetical protein
MRILRLSVPILLAGCVVPHQLPPAAKTATVIFSAEPDAVMVQAFADRSCSPHPNGTRLAYFYRDYFDRRTGAPKSVLADRELVFTFRARLDDGVSVTVCESTRAFMPAPGKTSRAHFLLNPKSCDVLVRRQDHSNAGQTSLVEVPLQVVQPSCFNEISG